MKTTSRHKSNASPLWSRDKVDPPRTATRDSGGTGASSGAAGTGGRDNGDNQSSSPPRDIASMKAEIADIQSDTTASLDRAIATARAAQDVGTHVSTELQEQREQMGHIDRDARAAEADLKRTNYNLKYGFSWRGALTSPFRRASKKPVGSGGVTREVSPVFRDDYQPKAPTSEPLKAGEARNGDSKGAVSSKAQKSKLFGSLSPRNKKKGGSSGYAAAEAEATAQKLPENVPEGFEKQLDALDGLLDGLTVQAKAIGTELKQQNEGIEAIGARVEPMQTAATSQAKQIKRRFGVKGP